MPIRVLLRNDHAFTPEEVATLVAAFEETLKALQLTNREDPATLLVAKVILEAAKQGELHPDRLRAIAVKEFSTEGASGPGDDDESLLCSNRSRNQT